MLGWVRVAAGERFPELEIHAAKVTDERRQGAAQLAAELASWPATVVSNAALSLEPILASPRFLISTIEQIVADVQERRERYGITYLTVFGEYVDSFSQLWHVGLAKQLALCRLIGEHISARVTRMICSRKDVKQ
jgi:hypothetical protein